MNKLYLILLFIFLISFTSALELTIYSGETIYLPVTGEYSYYSIIGNSTPVDIDSITQLSNYTVEMIFNKYAMSNKFEIIFYDEDGEIVDVYSSGGSSSSGGGTIIEDKDVIEDYGDGSGIIDPNLDSPYLENDDIPEEVIDDSNSYLIPIILIVSVLLLTLITYYMKKRKKLKVTEENPLDDDTIERGLEK